MINYNYSYDVHVDRAYIITIKDNEMSEKLAQRCAASCEKVGQPYEIYYGFNGTDKKNVVPPENLKDASWLSWIKLYTNVLSSTQLACFYSHFSLWAKCLEVDKPIVILEHDAIMLQQYDSHPVWGGIVYLGCEEQKDGGALFSIPPHASAEDGRNRFMCRAHAYAIDPPMAKNLISHVIKNGICTSLDVTIRADLFPITQNGLYAYDSFAGSTIHMDWGYLEQG